MQLPRPQRDLRSVVGISDFYSARQWRSVGSRCGICRPLGFQHDLMLTLPSVPGPVSGRTERLLFFRERGPDFSERDRALLTLLRPHLSQAYLDAQGDRHPTPRLTHATGGTAPSAGDRSHQRPDRPAARYLRRHRPHASEEHLRAPRRIQPDGCGTRALTFKSRILSQRYVGESEDDAPANDRTVQCSTTRRGGCLTPWLGLERRVRPDEQSQGGHNGRNVRHHHQHRIRHGHNGRGHRLGRQPAGGRGLLERQFRRDQQPADLRLRRVRREPDHLGQRRGLPARARDDVPPRRRRHQHHQLR